MVHVPWCLDLLACKVSCVEREGGSWDEFMNKHNSLRLSAPLWGHNILVKNDSHCKVCTDLND